MKPPLPVILSVELSKDWSMMVDGNNLDIRWKQRFQNFEKSLLLLEGALKIEAPDIYQRAGMIQFFETTFELSWKTMKDYFEAEGFADAKSPRSVIKKAFETGLVEDGHVWMELLKDRNLTAHTYDEATAEMVEKLIEEKYYPVIRKLYESFRGLANG
jgi:nucleotidyltransferase substrate binding protein (TIGR01987 family)